MYALQRLSAMQILKMFPLLFFDPLILNYLDFLS